jgi:NAD(P)-dependent dehydrogenase (short-subunit alcohol dehydrogenase family)
MTHTLHGQSVLVLGGSSGIGKATAAEAQSLGASVTITGRRPEILEVAAADINAARTAAFDAYDRSALLTFFETVNGPIDYVLVAAGAPTYDLLADVDVDRAARSIAASITLMLTLGQLAPSRIRDGGSVTFIGGTGARRPVPGLSVLGALSAGRTALIRSLAVESAPARFNLIAAGFVDTPLSAALLGDALEQRRVELQQRLPIHRVVQADDVAQLAVQIMTNTALTGAVFDIDGGEQLLS